MKYISQKDLAKYRKENTPEACPILGMSGYTPVVDHDHKSGNIRGVISSEGNALIGKIENFFRSRCVHSKDDLPTVLHNIAKYIQQEQGPLHPVGKRQLVRRYANKNKQEQILILEQLGCDQQSIEECKNSKERTKLYGKMLIQ